MFQCFINIAHTEMKLSVYRDVICFSKDTQVFTCLCISVHEEQSLSQADITQGCRLVLEHGAAPTTAQVQLASYSLLVVM